MTGTSYCVGSFIQVWLLCLCLFTFLSSQIAVLVQCPEFSVVISEWEGVWLVSVWGNRTLIPPQPAKGKHLAVGHAREPAHNQCLLMLFSSIAQLKVPNLKQVVSKCAKCQFQWIYFTGTYKPFAVCISTQRTKSILLTIDSSRK